MDEDRYEIVDDNGTVYQDDYDRIISVWNDILNDTNDYDGWEGDIKLVKVLGIVR